MLDRHLVLGTPLAPPWPAEVAPHLEEALFGMGCFWGAERLFWETPGVYTTAVGYAGGETSDPTYEEVCSGRTGHAEVVRVVFDRRRIDYGALLRRFWEGHDPTQGMRQGNAYQKALEARGHGPITTEIREAPRFYYAEDYHQQYLARVPGGYCGLGGTGVGFPRDPA